jgi:hypothetical protein
VATVTFTPPKAAATRSSARACAARATSSCAASSSRASRYGCECPYRGRPILQACLSSWRGARA